MNKNSQLFLAILFLAAVVLRVIYFQWALEYHTIGTLFRSIPDTGIYWTIAQHFLYDNINGPYWIFQVGPGYGILVAAIYKLGGSNFHSLYIIQILFGSAFPIVIYMLAHEMFDNSRIACIAGIITALSFTGIILSCNIISDMPFILFFTLSLYFYVKGLKKTSVKYMFWAGLLAALAIYIRSIIILWPIIFLVLPPLIHGRKHKGSRKAFYKLTAVTALVLLVSIISWSSYNYFKNDVFTFGGNGVKTTRLRLAALSAADHTAGLSYGKVIKQWSEEDSVVFNNQLPSFADEYKRDKDHLIQIVFKHPDWIAATYFKLLHENITAGNYIPKLQISGYENLWDTIAWHYEYWLGYLMLLLTLLGAYMMFQDGHKLSASILLVTYLYFMLLSGLSMWQGTRLVYPADIGGIIVISYLLNRFYEIIKNRLGKTEPV